MGKVVSNLPIDSLPWGRDIERRLEQLEALVSSNEVNNAARDQRMETNLLKVSELLSNTAALKTYQIQMPSAYRDYFLANVDNQNIDTTDLLINFSIDKARVVSFEYSTDFKAVTVYPSSSDLSVSWDIFSSLILNGEYISLSIETIDDAFLTSNPYTRREIARTHKNVERKLLQPGDYELVVQVNLLNNSSASTTTMSFSGDVLSASIIE